MPTPYRCIFAAGALLSMLAVSAFAPPAVQGQFTSFHVPDHPTAGNAAAVYASWAGAERADALLLELPAGWSVISADVLQDGYLPVPSGVRRIDRRRHRIELERSLDGPAEIVIRVEVGDRTETARCEISAMIRRGGRFLRRDDLALTRTVQPRASAPDPENRVLSFSADDAEPLLLRRERLPALSLRRSFSLAFWLKTTAPGQVVLSTWNGDDHQPYPVEIVIDRSGRLHSFRGRPGEHQSLSTKAPVADGSWHRVAVENDGATGWTHLLVDGSSVDSLFSPVPPPIDMELDLAVGGRVPGRQAYFDRFDSFSGTLDDVIVTAGEHETLRLDFEAPVSDELLHRPQTGLRQEVAERLPERGVEELRAERVSNGIRLSWRFRDGRATGFLVERSFNGNTFEPVEQIAANPSGTYTTVDSEIGDRVVYYRVRRIISQEAGEVSGMLKVGLGGELPDLAVLYGNFPNPFNASTTISYQVREQTEVRLSVWDLAGQPIVMLVDHVQAPGHYETRFAADELPSGTYFVRLRTREGVQSHKMILTK